MVIFTTAPIIKDIYFVLMEGKYITKNDLKFIIKLYSYLALPVSINYDSVVNDLCEIEHVKRAHNLHIWCLTMDKFALSVHLVTEKDIDTQKVLKDANNLLRTKYKIEKTTIQIEYFKESMVNCQDCKLPD
jgi:cobalt-zinc-cadmium efflux system protein